MRGECSRMRLSWACGLLIPLVVAAAIPASAQIDEPNKGSIAVGGDSREGLGGSAQSLHVFRTSRSTQSGAAAPANIVSSVRTRRFLLQRSSSQLGSPVGAQRPSPTVSTALVVLQA